MITIKCKYCGKELEISEALTHQIEEKAGAELKQKLAGEFEQQLKNLEKEKAEAKEYSRGLIKQLENLTDELRQLRRKDEERELTMKKKMADQEAEIKQAAHRQFLAEHDLKDKEKDKKMTDMLTQIEQLKAKAQQGSQQTQGEVLELELEELLKKEFPDDEITEVKKGQRGADVVQVVVDKRGQNCGTILWESKNAKWTDSWLQTLRENLREAKAQLGILVATNHPKAIGLFKYQDGVWVTGRSAMINLASALRFDLIHVNQVKLQNVGKNEKMEVLYQYITGTEFTHRIEAIVESFTNLQTDIEKEKRWFSIKWARQEKEIRKVIDSTHGVYGELQAVSGRGLVPIKQLETGED